MSAYLLWGKMANLCFWYLQWSIIFIIVLNLTQFFKRKDCMNVQDNIKYLFGQYQQLPRVFRYYHKHAREGIIRLIIQHEENDCKKYTFNAYI